MATTGLFVQFNLDTETIGGGWKLYHYAPGTTTLKNVYTDRALTTPAAQPVVADANGVMSFYADGLYDLVVHTSADVLKYTWEDVYFAELQSLGTEGAALASAGTLILGATSEVYYHVTGSSAISALSGTQSFVILTFDSTPILTNGASFVVRNSETRQARANETVMFVNDGGGIWREVSAVLRLANTQWLTGRNAAGSAEVNIVRVTSNNVLEFGGNILDTGFTLVDEGDVTKKALFDASGIATATTRTLTFPNKSGTLALTDDLIILAAVQTTTSGTSKDFTGIPAGTKRITVTLVGVSTNGTATLVLQLGDAGGIENTGYDGVVSAVVNAGATQANAATSYFALTVGNVAAGIYTGKIVLDLHNDAAFTWVASSVLARTDTATIFTGAGAKSLSAVLDRVRLTTTGADTFDAGAVNISYE